MGSRAYLSIEWRKHSRGVLLWACIAVNVIATLFQPTISRGNVPAGVQTAVAASSVGWILITLALLIILTEERVNHTDRLALVSGWTRSQYFVAKTYTVCSLIIMFWVGPLTIGIARDIMEGRTDWISTGAAFVGLLLQLTLAASFAFGFGVNTRSLGISLAIAVLFYLVQAPLIARGALGDGPGEALTQFLPLRLMGQLVRPHDGLGMNIWSFDDVVRALAVAAYCSAVVSVAWGINHRKSF